MTTVIARAMFKRRLGLSLEPRNTSCVGGHHCPGILELNTGDYAIIGTDITDAASQLPAGSGCGPGEKMVRIPRQVLVEARAEIPKAI